MKDKKQLIENTRENNDKSGSNQLNKIDITGLDHQFVGMQSIRPQRSVVRKSIKPDHSSSKSVGRKY